MLLRIFQVASVIASIALAGCSTAPQRKPPPAVQRAVDSATNEQALALINAICLYRAKEGVWPDSLETLFTGFSPRATISRASLESFEQIDFRPQADDSLILEMSWRDDDVPYHMTTHLQVPED